MGSSRKEPCEIERKNAEGMRRSIVTKQDIDKGTIITKEILTFKRPANGLPPKYFFDIVDRTTKRKLSRDTLIDWSDLV